MDFGFLSDLDDIAPDDWALTPESERIEKVMNAITYSILIASGLWASIVFCVPENILMFISFLGASFLLLSNLNISNEYIRGTRFGNILVNYNTELPGVNNNVNNFLPNAIMQNNNTFPPEVTEVLSNKP